MINATNLSNTLVKREGVALAAGTSSSPRTSTRLFVIVQNNILSTTPPPSPTFSRRLLLGHLLADQALHAQVNLQLHRRVLAWHGRDVQDGEASNEKLSPLLGVSAE